MKKRDKYLPFLVFCLLSACASNSGVVPLGNNSFIISKQAATGFPGTGKIKTEALKEASEKCIELNMAVEIKTLEESKPPYLLGNYPRVDLTFNCVDEGAE